MGTGTKHPKNPYKTCVFCSTFDVEQEWNNVEQVEQTKISIQGV